MSERLDLEPDPASVALARRWCREVLGPWVDDEVCATVVLLVSELVSNAVLHARTPCSLAIDPRVGRIHVEVRDDDDRLPERAADLDPHAASGRGLLLVHRLSAASGIDREPGGGKRVWFEVDAAVDAAAAHRWAVDHA